MISLLLGFVIGLLLYISIVYFIIVLEDVIFAFKYRNIGKFSEEFAFIIDDTIIRNN